VTDWDFANDLDSVRMSVTDWPLGASQEVLRVFAQWAKNLRTRMLEVINERPSRNHRQAAAAHVLRLQSLCEAIVLLNEHGLFEESATLVRVLAEFAICADWIGTDDSRAWDFGSDLADSTMSGDKRRKEHLNIEPSFEQFENVKRIVNLAERAKQAGTGSMKLYAAIWDIVSQPTHNATSVIGRVEKEAQERWGRGIAALAVNAASHLAYHTAKTLGIEERRDMLRIALEKWAAARPAK